MKRLRTTLAALTVLGLVAACTESSSVRDASGNYGGPINQPMVTKRNDGNL